MDNNSVIHIVGARPQFIKLSPVLRVLDAMGIASKVIHTGQHYDYEMSSLMFEELGLKEPEYNLGVGSSTHGRQTAEMLSSIEAVLIKESPPIVLVYGDTNSTLAGALASVKLGIPVAHVEAGLRSFERYMPEEINRILTDHMSEHLFCPTQRAVKQLSMEGLAGVFTGDVMLDAMKTFLDMSHPCPVEGTFVLVTIHRQENTDNRDRLLGILSGIRMLAREVKVVFPVHPRTRKILETMEYSVSEGLLMARPVGYLDMLAMIRDAMCVVTDSGGVQKEAFMLRTPCVTVRNKTEWPETVETGWNRLVEPDDVSIYSSVMGMKDTRPVEKNAMPFGDGKASHYIAQYIEEHLEKHRL